MTGGLTRRGLLGGAPAAVCLPVVGNLPAADPVIIAKIREWAETAPPLFNDKTWAVIRRRDLAALAGAADPAEGAL